MQNCGAELRQTYIYEPKKLINVAQRYSHSSGCDANKIIDHKKFKSDVDLLYKSGIVRPAEIYEVIKKSFPSCSSKTISNHVSKIRKLQVTTKDAFSIIELIDICKKNGFKSEDEPYVIAYEENPHTCLYHNKFLA